LYGVIKVVCMVYIVNNSELLFLYYIVGNLNLAIVDVVTECYVLTTV